MSEAIEAEEEAEGLGVLSLVGFMRVLVTLPWMGLLPESVRGQLVELDAEETRIYVQKLRNVFIKQCPGSLPGLNPCVPPELRP